MELLRYIHTCLCVLSCIVSCAFSQNSHFDDMINEDKKGIARLVKVASNRFKNHPLPSHKRKIRLYSRASNLFLSISKNGVVRGVKDPEGRSKFCENYSLYSVINLSIVARVHVLSLSHFS